MFRFGSAIAALLVATVPTVTVAETLTVLGHAVHQRVSTGEVGTDTDATLPFTSAGNDIDWLTFGVEDIHDRAFREASLDNGTIDVVFLLNRFATPEVVTLFTPLDEFQSANAIDDFEELAPGMREAFTFDGQLYGIPFRHATSAMHLNTELLAEVGLEGIPSSIEEVFDWARKATYTRADGTEVFGFLLDSPNQSGVIDVARAWDGDYITGDLTSAANGEGTVNAVAAVADLYQEGVMPKAFINFSTEDVITYMQQGRAAIAFSPFGRNKVFNDPDVAKHPGKIITVNVPISESFADQFDIAPAKTEFWVVAIPKNAPNPELAWEFIKTISSPEATLIEALNGNGPVRGSAYSNANIQERLPYAKYEAAAVAVARPPLPGFRGSAKAQELFALSFQEVLIGSKDAQTAMDELQAATEELLAE